ncbi:MULTISPECIES: CheB methylesterase domain-containing protein [unclassified Helicobacter]|uniref:CheB methylesterase domain-containing protein n=1 Tax=unclassified Helicobacter TaxID=2593540 RepID=UPI0009F1E7A5|nr:MULTISPECIES: CheB methylesterase domain-containing protein [unclassified Helicobacter]
MAIINPKELQPPKPQRDTKPQREIEERLHPDVLIKSSPCLITREKLIVIGSSTGGPLALEEIMSMLPTCNLPPIVIAQHIPETFSLTLAKRLDSKSRLSVFEVNERLTLKNDCAYLAKGGTQIMLSYDSGRYSAYPMVMAPRISRHRPSVDVLFRAANNTAGKNTLAIMLTGMGDDGCIGIKELHDNGSKTIAQDEQTCVVFGMPKRAIEVGAVDEILPLDKIASKIVEFAKSDLRNGDNKNDSRSSDNKGEKTPQ